MKPQSAAFTTRCSYRTSGGRQCRLLSNDPHSGLCPEHLQKQNEFADLSKPLLVDWQGFQTAQGLNFTLSNLYRLLAANRISARRASVLAYINSLLLRTLPAIDADRVAGIEVPEAFREQPAPTASDTNQGQAIAAEPDKAGASDPTAAQANPASTSSATPTSSPRSASVPAGDSSSTAPQTQLQSSAKPTSPAPTSGTTPSKTLKESSAWPSGIPEPDPTKKPS